MDHDQRFKTLIQTFFADFMRLFFADWAARFDLDTLEWVETELLPDPPEGTRHQLDLVARLKTRENVPGMQPDDPDRWLALVHIEIEAPDRTTSIKRRLPRYYIHLREKSGLPVLPIVVYLKVGLDGIGSDLCEERFWEFQTLTFHYLYVGLPGLDGVQYVQGDNWLGIALAALMRIPRDKVAWLGAEALRRLTEAQLSDQEKFLLAECVQAYLPLDERQKQEYERLLLGEPYTKVRAMNKTVFEEGLEKGRERGIEEGMEKGLQNTLLRLGRRRFGPPSDDSENQIHAIQDIARLEALTDRILDVHSWEALLNG